MKKEIKIGKHTIGDIHPTYFIADIAANHDGEIDRAKLLIKLAKESGADAVKFQHHDVKKYVSDYGFKNLGGKFSHQSKWEKSIFEVYKDAEVPRSWTEELMSYCKKLDITFFTTPYDLDTVDYIDKYVPAFKIGSGDVAWFAMLKKIARTNKPVLFATGASTMQEVINAVNIISKINKNVILMQCTSSYPCPPESMNIKAIDTMKTAFNNIPVGISDHVIGDMVSIGAVASGADIIEKHFTSDKEMEGPDHILSMTPEEFLQMKQRVEVVEKALGDGIKQPSANEVASVIRFRKTMYTKHPMNKGDIISVDDIIYTAPAYGIYAKYEDIVIGQKLNQDIGENMPITWDILGGS